MKTRLAFLIAPLLSLLIPAVAFAQGISGAVTTGGGILSGNGWAIAWGSGASTCSGTLCAVGQNLLYLINYVAVPLLFAIAFIVFLYGVAQTYIFSRGDTKKVETGHQLILWGLIGFAVMISVWGLVNVVVNTFGLGGYAAPALPTSY